MTTDADRSALVQEISTLQRRLTTEAWRYAGQYVTFPELSAQQLRVLLLIAHSPGIVAAQLCVQLGVTAATASGIVGGLVERGLVVRREDPHDRRVRRLELTEAGEAILGELDAANEIMFTRLAPLVSTDVLASIRDAYTAFLNALTETLAPAPAPAAVDTATPCAPLNAPD